MLAHRCNSKSQYTIVCAPAFFAFSVFFFSEGEPLRRFIDSFLTKHTICLYLLSVLLLLLATVLQEEYVSQSAIEMLKIFGAGIFITTLVTSILNFYFREDIHRYFSTVGGAENAGIQRIYANRKHALIEINEEFQKALGNIEILAIAGTDFFQGVVKS